MPRLNVHSPSGTRSAVLVGSTLLGRHWRCDVRLSHPAVPLYWLEVRWSGSYWAWRCLGGADHTRGRGAADVRGWRRFSLEDTIELPQAGVTLQLVDNQAPVVVLENMEDGRWVDDEERFEHIALTREGPVGIDADGEPTTPPLNDGSEIVSSGTRWRVHVPTSAQATRGGVLSLEQGPISLDFDLAVPSVIISGPGGEVELRSSLVRTLATYSAAHHDARTPGGWLTNPQARQWTEWLGGEPASTPDRVNWDRARVRSALQEKGIGGVDTMFERFREAGVWFHRLRMVPDVYGLPSTLPDPSGPRLSVGLAPERTQ